MTAGTSIKSGTALSADGVPISYSISGAGNPALVFVHGWCGEQNHWREQIAHFSAEYTVVTIDLAGHGVSGSNRSLCTIEAFAQDVAAVVRSLKLGHVVLIGHSLGGSVVAEASALLEGETIALIGVDTWSSLQSKPGSSQAQEQLLAALRADFKPFTRQWIGRMFGKSADPNLVSGIVEGMAGVNPDIALSAMQFGGAHTPVLQQRLRKLPVPAYLIASQNSLYPKDPAVAQEYGIGFEEMPGVGHFLMLEAPADFNGRLAAALQKLVLKTASGA